jgi:hypothetical protein
MYCLPESDSFCFLAIRMTAKNSIITSTAPVGTPFGTAFRLSRNTVNVSIEKLNKMTIKKVFID